MRRNLIEEEMTRLPAPDILSFDESLIDADHLPKERKKPGRKKGWSKAMAESSIMWGGNSSSAKTGKGPGKGSIPQLIPDALIPELCRKITANGTRARDDIIKQFTTDHPEASIRQCLIKFQELTTKYKPLDSIPQPEKVSGRAWVFYLRPRFYHMLDEDERPHGWESAAVEDEELYAKECKAKADDEQEKAASEAAASNDRGQYDDDASNLYASTIGTDESGDDEEQPAKKMKLG